MDEVTEQEHKLDPALYSSRSFPHKYEQSEVKVTVIDQPAPIILAEINASSAIETSISSQSDKQVWLILIGVAVLFVLITGKQKIDRWKRTYAKR